MADSDADRFEGASCHATLDTVAQTLTFEHHGWGATKEQKILSPVVVPLGAIGAVEFEKHWLTGISESSAADSSRGCTASIPIRMP